MIIPSSFWISVGMAGQKKAAYVLANSHHYSNEGMTRSPFLEMVPTRFDHGTSAHLHGYVERDVLK